MTTTDQFQIGDTVEWYNQMTRKSQQAVIIGYRQGYRHKKKFLWVISGDKYRQVSPNRCTKLTASSKQSIKNS